MRKIYEESEIETTAEEKAHGLRRIKRLFRPQPGEKIECKVWLEIELDGDVLDYFQNEAGEANYKTEINRILREKMHESLALKTAELKKLRSELLNDKDFLRELKEKLAA